jgi:hypothetical protein
MSRSPGQIERAIRGPFDAHPDAAFTTDDVCVACCPGTDHFYVEHKHVVAVM